VPLDVADQVELTIDQFERAVSMSNSNTTQFLQQLMPYAFKAFHHCMGMEGMLLRELVALTAISRPSLFQVEPMAIDVEVEGRLTWGMTVADRRRFSRTQPNIDVLTGVDEQGVLDYMREILALHK
jgi:inosine-uridine nucleoside N-ribohydrolase